MQLIRGSKLRKGGSSIDAKIYGLMRLLIRKVNKALFGTRFGKLFFYFYVNSTIFEFPTNFLVVHSMVSNFA
jgi:hypothetical protein